MSAIKKSVSFPEELFNAAQERQKKKNFATFSDYLQALIRADMEATAQQPEIASRVNELRDQIRDLAVELNAAASGKPVSYRKTPKRPRKSVVPPIPRHKLNES